MNESPTSTTQPVADQPAERPTTTARRGGPSTAQIAIVVAILGGGVLFTAMTSDVAKTSEPGVKLSSDGTPFLADQVGDWTGGERTGLTEDEIRLLPKDTEGSRRLFKDRNGDELFCSVVLAGRDVTSIHRPELCLPGQGWKIQSEFTQDIPMASVPGGTLSVMRMNATRAYPQANGTTTQARSIFVYWFVGKDRVTPYHWQRIFWTARDRVLHNTNHRWAYILIHVPLAGDSGQGGTAKTEDDAMKIAANFVHDVYPSMVQN
jgi:EpsI family protein